MSSCGCSDGWIYVGDAVRACVPCQKRAKRGEYAAGGETTRVKKRRAYKAYCRKGGIASGVKRRQLARGRRPPRRRSRDQALNLAYAHKQPNEEQLRALYFAARPNGNEGGFQTYREYVIGLFRRYRVAGQHFGTTNAQRAADLASRGRARDHRTLQRLNRLVEQTGLAWVIHDKRGGAEPGNKDRLVVEIRSPKLKNVTPPPGAVAGLVPHPATAALETDLAAGNDLSPPASPAVPPAGGDQRQAASPPGSEREGIEAQVRFVQLKLEMGFGDRARRPRAAVVPEGSGQAISRIASRTAAGFR